MSSHVSSPLVNCGTLKWAVLNHSSDWRVPLAKTEPKFKWAKFPTRFCIKTILAKDGEIFAASKMFVYVYDTHHWRLCLHYTDSHTSPPKIKRKSHFTYEKCILSKRQREHEKKALVIFWMIIISTSHPIRISFENGMYDYSTCVNGVVAHRSYVYTHKNSRP